MLPIAVLVSRRESRGRTQSGSGQGVDCWSSVDVVHMCFTMVLRLLWDGIAVAPSFLAGAASSYVVSACGGGSRWRF